MVPPHLGEDVWRLAHSPPLPGPCSENDTTVGGLVRGYHRGGKTLEDAGVARHELDIGICVCVRVCLLSFLDPLHVYKN